MDVAADWYWSLTVTVNVNDLVESAKSLGSMVPIRLPWSERVIPVGSVPAVTEYVNTLLGSSAMASMDKRLGMSAVSVPITVGVVKAIPMSISPITFMVNCWSVNTFTPDDTVLLARTVKV